MHDKRGLPTEIKMRHDKHYVEELFKDYSSAGDYRLIDINAIILNEEQPRKDIGDLDGLALSVKEKGILEPVLVRKMEDSYSIISGERRYKAALIAGLQVVPAIILNVDDLNTLEIALIENLQRKDLTPFEEADAYALLVNKFNLTHEDIARKIGKSRINITETISISRIPAELREFCLQNGITSKSVLVEISRIQNFDEMQNFINEIITKGMSRSDIREKRSIAADKKQNKAPFVFKYRPMNKSFQLSLRFKKTQVEKEEIIQALLQIIEELKMH